MPELDDRLASARADLLDDIRPPGIDAVRTRATSLRRRRAATRVAVAAVVLAGAGVTAVTARGPEPQQPAATPSVHRQTWQANGLSVVGLAGSVALDLPGDVYEVRFADNRRAYALAADCPETDGAVCALSLAVTDDGGDTWVRRDAPVASAPVAALPTLVPLGRDAVAVTGTPGLISLDAARTWREGRTATAAAAIPAPGRPHLVGGRVGTWLPDGALATLVHQPDLEPRWVAPEPAGGAWWVGGVRAGSPAVALTRDDGRTWSTTTLPGSWPSGSWARVAAQGATVHAVVVTGEPAATGNQVHGLTRSVDGGKTFTGYGNTAPDGPAKGLTVIAGDLVPLLDGRLVAAGPGWRVSDPTGSRFVEPGEQLPWLAAIRRSGPGWVAIDVFAAGWAAYSFDGETWHKLRLL